MYQLPEPQRPVTGRFARRERGASALEYVGVLTLAAVLAGVVVVAATPADVGATVSSAVCTITGGADCDSPTAETIAADEESPPSPLPPDNEIDEENPLDRCQGSWPDLVGLDGEEAMRALQEEDPDLNVSVVPAGSNVTADFACGRVRIIVDDDGTVTGAPSIG